MAWLDDVNAQAGSNPLIRFMALPAALLVGRDAELEGGERGTRQLAGLLTHSVRAAIERNDEDKAKRLGAELLAVLSDIADLGDEETATGINTVAEEVGADVVELARHIGRLRASR